MKNTKITTSSFKQNMLFYDFLCNDINKIPPLFYVNIAQVHLDHVTQLHSTWLEKSKVTHKKESTGGAQMLA